jgi:Ca2+-binding EF-hand superfamily protein
MNGYFNTGRNDIQPSPNKPFGTAVSQIRDKDKRMNSSKSISVQDMEEHDLEDGGNTQFTQHNVPSYPLESEEFKVKREAIMKVFHRADVNKDGILSEKEIHTFLQNEAKKNGQKFNKEVVIYLVSKMDQNKDGKVDSEEFVDFYI